MILLLIAFGIGVCVGVSAAFVWQAWTRENAPLPLGTVAAKTTAHIHEATTAGPKGWRCECGKHKHIYVFETGTSKKRCQCGALGVGKEWA